MNKCGLPLNTDEFNDYFNGEISIDMNDLNFDVESDKLIHSLLIYIRNIGIENNLLFHKCSYEMKEELLLSYLKENIHCKLLMLNTTWISILYFDTNINPFKYPDQCILTPYEIKKFNERNFEYITKIKQFMISIPLCSMAYFYKDDKDSVAEKFETSDEYIFNMNNFGYCLDYNEFIMLCQNITGLTPKFYTKYFFKSSDDLNQFYHKLITSFPYLNLMNLLVNSNQDFVNNFMKNLESFLSPKEE